MTTQKILADRPSRVETMTGLATDQVDQLVLLVYADTGFVPGRRRTVGKHEVVVADGSGRERSHISVRGTITRL